MPWRSNLKTAFTADPVAPPEPAAQDIPDSGKPRAPRCPDCHIETLWYQSRLQRQNGKSKILHLSIARTAPWSCRRKSRTGRLCAWCSREAPARNRAVFG